ncbi:MAG: hypothetical protein K8E66_06760 [Phycisphaerales bacterium]|nr:hypothetical protein [Phycisphaerales bacterium]
MTDEPHNASSQQEQPQGTSGSMGQATPGTGGAPNGVRLPLLISAILNCLNAVAWAFGCVTIVISIPLLVLAVFEFMAYSKLGQPDYRQEAGRVKVLQILEICTILVGNVGSLICGIIGMVLTGQEREKGNF